MLSHCIILDTEGYRSLCTFSAVIASAIGFVETFTFFHCKACRVYKGESPEKRLGMPDRAASSAVVHYILGSIVTHVCDVANRKPANGKLSVDAMFTPAEDTLPTLFESVSQPLLLSFAILAAFLRAPFTSVPLN